MAGPIVNNTQFLGLPLEGNNKFMRGTTFRVGQFKSGLGHLRHHIVGIESGVFRYPLHSFASQQARIHIGA